MKNRKFYRNLKLQINSKWKKAFILFFSVLLLNSGVAYTTGFNAIETLAKMFLDFVSGSGDVTPTVTFTSDDYNEETFVTGSWKVLKKAEWLNNSEVNLTYNIESFVKPNMKNRDAIIVLDTSISLNERNRLDKLKAGLKSFTNKLLEDNNANNNTISLISFNTDASLLTNSDSGDFTGNLDFINEKIDGLSASGKRNYIQALQKVSLVLGNYSYVQERSPIVYFITNGFPTDDENGSRIEFQKLKVKYNFIDIIGVQYDVNVNNFIKPLRDISDTQKVISLTDIYSPLFYSLGYSTQTHYDSYKIVDYINNVDFSIENENMIEASIGSVNFDNSTYELQWDLEDKLLFGEKAKLSIRLNLEKANSSKDYVYSLGRDMSISESHSGKNFNKSYKLTSSIKRYYNVLYDANIPENYGCNIKVKETEKLLVFDKIEISKKPFCPNYLFRGWEIVDNDVEKINDDIFVMPGKDVLLRAVWSKFDIEKSFMGDISTEANLYKKIKSDYEMSKDLKGAEKLTLDNGNSIYYYKKGQYSNVVFAGFCWQIVRTTETGGVKLIYYGVYQNGQCGFDKHIGNMPFSDRQYMGAVGYMLNDDYYKTYETTPDDFGNINVEYSSQYNPYVLFDVYIEEGYNIKVSQSYRKNGSKYQLENALTIQTNIWKQVYENYNDYYICVKSNSIYNVSDTNNCDDLYYIVKSAEGVFIEPINRSVKVFKVSNNFKYGNNVVYENGKYKLVETSEYPFKQFWNWKENYGGLNSYHYTCFNENGICSSVFYILDRDELGSGVVRLINGDMIEDYINATTGNVIDDYNKYNTKDKNNIYYINKNDSKIKKVIDKWYEDNILYSGYANGLEDTVFCYDRKLLDLNSTYLDKINGGGEYYNQPSFSSRYLEKAKFTCDNKIDNFTVSEKNGNGDLKYPIGLLIKSEADLMLKEYKNLGIAWWLGTPMTHGYGATPYEAYISNEGENTLLLPLWDAQWVFVRPVISLRPEIKYISGYGTLDAPYIIEKFE